MCSWSKNKPTGSAPHTFVFNGSTTSHHPRKQHKSQILSGELPLWRHRSRSGLPQESHQSIVIRSPAASSRTGARSRRSRLPLLTNFQINIVLNWPGFCSVLTVRRLVPSGVHGTRSRPAVVSCNPGRRAVASCSTTRPTGTWPVPARPEYGTACRARRARSCTRR